jgi:DNA-directed RNA polymerase
VTLQYGDGHEPEIRKDKAANGIAPNFVHACDATHLLMVANACAAEGIPLATVHDSFGCLSPHAGRFRKLIRREFVRLYAEHDPFRKPEWYQIDAVEVTD